MNTCPNRGPVPGVVTVTADVPLCPSLVAVMVAEPTVTPVTRPLELTVATEVLLLDQLTVRPDSRFRYAFAVVAVTSEELLSSTVAKTAGPIPGPAGGFVTVTAAVPLCPSLVAVIVAVPATVPVTSPLALTVATEVLLLAHVTVRPDSGFPVASLGVATSCTVCPTWIAAVAGLTLTEATATLETVMLAVPLCPSLVAVIVADPIVTPVTSPLPSTVATEVLLLVQLTARPGSGLPLASFGVAVSCTV